MTSAPHAPDLKSLIEVTVIAVCGPLPGLRFVVDAVEADGEPVKRLRVSATLHFQGNARPFCCLEPDCHLGIRFARRNAQIVEKLKQLAGWPLLEAVAFDEIEAVYGEGVASSRRAKPDPSAS